MPRTKVVKSKRKPAPTEDTLELIKALKKIKSQLKAKLEVTQQFHRTEMANGLRDLDSKFTMFKLQVGSTMGNKTIAELRNENTTLLESVYEHLSSASSLEVSKIKKPKLRRSISFTEDDGYLTAESTDSKSSERQSRSIARAAATKTMSTRVSRSLSRSKMQQKVVMNSYMTPAHTKNPGTFGMVTPKVKPNTPSVVLRRPKQGEVAISLQGSPLMVNPCTSDQIANLNIPLQDGRLLSIQPQRGLRVSQIPELDTDVQKQLQALRDNLNKVCALVASRQ